MARARDVAYILTLDATTPSNLDLTTWLQLAALVCLLAASAFFSSSETSLFSLDAVDLDQMERDGNTRVGLLRRLLAEPRRLIVTILIGNELVNVAASVISASLVIRMFGAENSWLNLLIMVPALLLFGEITPKTLAFRRNRGFATFQSVWIDLFARAISPVRWVVRRVADVFITMAVGPERSPANIVTEDMVRSLADEAVGEGALDRREAHYIKRIFEFGDRELSDLMTPRSRMQTFVLGQPLADVVAELAVTGHTKVPVFEDEDEETVAGLLHARDLLGRNPGVTAGDDLRLVAAQLREPLLVPESKQASDLFRDFTRRHLSVAVVVDEFGGITGLVTMEDLLEEIFGDIPSRSDRLEEAAQTLDHLPDGGVRLDGRTSVTRFNEETGARMEEEGAESIGGVVLEALGEVPAEGASAIVDGWCFTVEEVVSHRIATVVATPSADEPSAGSPGATAAAADDGGGG